jgi:hypothetical protein
MKILIASLLLQQVFSGRIFDELLSGVRPALSCYSGSFITSSDGISFLVTRSVGSRGLLFATVLWRGEGTEKQNVGLF